jgi:hypothetical protein
MKVTGKEIFIYYYELNPTLGQFREESVENCDIRITIELTEVSFEDIEKIIEAHKIVEGRPAMFTELTLK